MPPEMDAGQKDKKTARMIQAVRDYIDQSTKMDLDYPLTAPATTPLMMYFWQVR